HTQPRRVAGQRVQAATATAHAHHLAPRHRHRPTTPHHTPLPPTAADHHGGRSRFGRPIPERRGARARGEGKLNVTRALVRQLSFLTLRGRQPLLRFNYFLARAGENDEPRPKRLL